jgi:hypothetical protein
MALGFITIEVKGFRVRHYDLVTTLLDAELYTSNDLTELYFRRWAVELFFRHIKTTMGMLLVIASEKVPLQENRSEPRVVKKRPKPYPRLTKHRAIYVVPKSRKNKGKRKAKNVVKAP